jgi:hypothetical protein
VPISQNELIQKRREQVQYLHWKGYSSYEIANEFAKMGLKVNARTIQLDVKWLEENATQEIKERKENIALAYENSVRTFKWLKQNAIEQFERAKRDNNEDRMERLYPILESIQSNIDRVESASDLIQATVLEEAKKQQEKIQGELDQVDQTSRDTEQAIF